jgi:photosystem II stability/assembly factor-like uncharacterized protein
VQPDEEPHVKEQPTNHGDHIVALGSSLRSRDKVRRWTPLKSDAVEHCVSEKRAEQDDGGEIAVGDEMGKRSNLDGDEERVPDLGLDLAR